jgi:hypothetical protein
MTDKEFCKLDTAFYGEEVDHIKQIALRTFNGEELKEYVEHCIKLHLLNIPDDSNSSFDDEKFIEALFAEYNKSYKETKQGQHYPKWLDDEQLKWVLTVVKNCC